MVCTGMAFQSRYWGLNFTLCISLLCIQCSETGRRWYGRYACTSRFSVFSLSSYTWKTRGKGGSEFVYSIYNTSQLWQFLFFLNCNASVICTELRGISRLVIWKFLQFFDYCKVQNSFRILIEIVACNEIILKGISRNSMNVLSWNTSEIRALNKYDRCFREQYHVIYSQWIVLDK